MEVREPTAPSSPIAPRPRPPSLPPRPPRRQTTPPPRGLPRAPRTTATPPPTLGSPHRSALRALIAPRPPRPPRPPRSRARLARHTRCDPSVGPTFDRARDGEPSARPFSFGRIASLKTYGFKMESQFPVRFRMQFPECRNRVPPGPYDTSTCAALPPRKGIPLLAGREHSAMAARRRRRQRATHTSGARVLYAPSSSQQKWPKSAPQTPRRPPPRQSLYSIRASTVSFVCSFVAMAISSVAPNLRDMVTRSSYVHETRTVPIEVHVGSVVSATSPARRGDRSVVNAG